MQEGKWVSNEFKCAQKHTNAVVCIQLVNIMRGHACTCVRACTHTHTNSCPPTSWLNAGSWLQESFVSLSCVPLSTFRCPCSCACFCCASRAFCSASRTCKHILDYCIRGPRMPHKVVIQMRNSEIMQPRLLLAGMAQIASGDS